VHLVAQNTDCITYGLISAHNHYLQVKNETKLELATLLMRLNAYTLFHTFSEVWTLV